MSYSSEYQQNRLIVSKIQEHFWILNHLNPDDCSYNISSIFRLEGNFNIDAFKRALNEVVQRHESLRTNFVYSDNQIFQIIHRESEADFVTIKIESSLSLSKLPDGVFNEVYHKFNLEKDRLLRVRLFQTGENYYYLTIVFHHTIIDLHSKDLFAREISILYNAYCQENYSINLNNPNQYRNYSTYHNTWLNSDEGVKLTKDWTNDLSGKDFQLNFPSDISSTNLEKGGKRKLFFITSDLTKKIKQFGRENSLNDFVIILSTYYYFLNRICNQEEICVGIPYSNRKQEEFQDTIGCFVNILPLHITVSGEESFLELAKKVRVSMLKVHRKQEIPYLNLSSIPDKGKLLFNTGFTFEYPIKLDLNGINVTNEIIEREGAQLDLFVTFWESKDYFQGFIEYSNQLFTGEFIEKLIKIFNTTLESVLENPECKLMDINITPIEDLKFILELNQTNTPYEDQICIHEKFSIQANKNPNLPAIVNNSDVITYEQLDRYSNSFAHFLISKNVKTEDIVALCCTRSLEMMICIFGILKAGAAYLPINPKDPSDRLDSILKDAKPKYILISRTDSANISSHSNVIYIDDVLKKPFNSDFSNPDIKVSSKNLAYIIYTSGSTGTPKGVMIEHHSVINRLMWMQKKYPISSGDTLLQKTPITFDVSVWELFWWSFTGARLCILNPEGEKDPENILKYISDYSVTTIHFVPSMFKIFTSSLKPTNVGKLRSLKRIFLSGEALPAKMVNDFNQVKNDHSINLINLYGPTEATVDVSYFDCPDLNADTIYIGKPIDNTKLFVINSSGKLQPVGLPGELIITGVNLSRGYLNRPDLNSSRFFDFSAPDSFSYRAYKTGDLVRLCPNGEIEYIGRNDNQVKIRGFRIELGEIESAILEYEGIDHCAVITNGSDENKYLIAYICKSNDSKFAEHSLKEFLKKKLPDYMIPSLYCILKEIPLTTSGKINRNALPKPERIIDRNLERPNSNAEKTIHDIWKTLLQSENIGVTENFFDIGGNSLLAIRLCTSLNEMFNISLTPIEIFQQTTIREQSNYIVRMTPRNELNASNAFETRMANRKQNIISRFDQKRKN